LSIGNAVRADRPDNLPLQVNAEFISAVPQLQYEIWDQDADQTGNAFILGRRFQPSNRSEGRVRRKS
jgi:hypothetical protein